MNLHDCHTGTFSNSWRQTPESSCTVFITRPTSHLPLVVRRLVLELDQPIQLAVEHGAVVHGDDDGPSQQGPGWPAAHHGAQHSLTIVHRGPGGAQRITHLHTCTQSKKPFSEDVTAALACVRADRVNTALGRGCGRRRCVPHVVLPLNRHIHLIQAALRNGPRWN